MDDETTTQAVWDQVCHHRGEANHDIARALGLPVEAVNGALERLEQAGRLRLGRPIDATGPLFVIWGTIERDAC